MLSGRVTDILVVKGDKIPSGPIEEELQAALDLHGVCVLSEQGPDGGDVMHIALEREAPYDKARLEALAKPYLTYFPTVSFHQLAAFPRNANGKVDRLKLRRVLVELGRARAAE
jgi:acyl-CoA synthetase (AMP-forming)/AMP-acid ligase II